MEWPVRILTNIGVKLRQSCRQPCSCMSSSAAWYQRGDGRESSSISAWIGKDNSQYSAQETVSPRSYRPGLTSSAPSIRTRVFTNLRAQVRDASATERSQKAASFGVNSWREGKQRGRTPRVASSVMAVLMKMVVHSQRPLDFVSLS